MVFDPETDAIKIKNERSRCRVERDNAEYPSTLNTENNKYFLCSALST